MRILKIKLARIEKGVTVQLKAELLQKGLSQEQLAEQVFSEIVGEYQENKGEYTQNENNHT